MDNTDRELLSILQADFPFVVKPYAAVAEKLGIGEDEVIRRIIVFKADGIVRQISPVMDARRLGYSTTLVAAKIDINSMDNAAEVFSNHPRISHAYQRSHEYNLWYTLAQPPNTDISEEISRIAGKIYADSSFSLPSTRLYKLGAFFGKKGSGFKTQQPGGKLSRVAELSAEDIIVINNSQYDLPLDPTPFSAMAGQAGLDEEVFLDRCTSLVERGIMRRYGASINHRRAGYTANAMVCWAVEPALSDTLGEKLASYREVSHCYERRTNSLWRHNIFAMIHGEKENICRDVADEVTSIFGIEDYIMLLSTREVKKARVRYTL
ncbi:AsnC family transcriptional regulator [Chloroflexota bacterium]